MPLHSSSPQFHTKHSAAKATQGGFPCPCSHGDGFPIPAVWAVSAHRASSCSVEQKQTAECQGKAGTNASSYLKCWDCCQRLCIVKAQPCLQQQKPLLQVLTGSGYGICSQKICNCGSLGQSNQIMFEGLIRKIKPCLAEQVSQLKARCKRV